jgi:hypothetical protein
MVERRRAKVGDIKITLSEVYKIGAVLGPIIGTLVFGWVNLNSTLADHARNQKDQAEELKKMHDDVAVISARQSATDDKVTRIMFYFRVPQEGSPFTVYPPQAQRGNVGKLKPMPPETPAPAIGMKGHALFEDIEPPQVVAQQPQPPEISHY